MQYQSVYDLIRRALPGKESCFLLREMKVEEAATGQNCYCVSSEGEKIILSGDCVISLCMAFYAYLREECGVNLSWCGNREIAVPEELPVPAVERRYAVPQQHRVYMNYCTFGYSALVWDWARWEKEIDFMAMNGVNMPLSIIGTQGVWFETLLEYGFTEREALAYLSGPAYWPWQLMTNLEGAMPPPDRRYVEQSISLGRKILERERSLGMTPIQQGYSGHVPRLFRQKFPQARIRETGGWCGFPPTAQLDPLDPLFARFGLSLLKKQEELFGCGRYLACDPFHENSPSVKGKAYLSKVGRAIDELYRSFRPDSIWVMQSWSLRKAIVKAVPKERLLILDLNSARAKGTKGFWGYPYVAGELHNFGGKNSLHGDLEAAASFSYRKQQKKHPNLTGAGLFMEGINQNPLFYDLQFTMLTQAEGVNLQQWLADYAVRRYGSDEACLWEALRLLRMSCYAAKTSDSERGSILCARPHWWIDRAAPNDMIEIRYSNRMLLRALEKLLEAKRAGKDGYAFDLCDIARQALSNHALSLYNQAMDGFFQHNRAMFEHASASFLELLQDMDRLLATRPELRLSRWAERAQKLGEDETMASYYRENALALITLWGPAEEPIIFDYAWREWSGLMQQFYGMRWRMFFAFTLEHFDTLPRKKDRGIRQIYGRDPFDATPFLHEIGQRERAFIREYRPAPEQAGEPVAVVRDLLQKYAAAISDDTTLPYMKEKANKKPHRFAVLFS